MTDFNKALHDPSAVYPEPKDVLTDDTLDKSQKLRVLHQWEYDAREMMVADEENMAGSDSSKIGANTKRDSSLRS